MIEAIVNDVGMFREQRVNRPAEVSDALAVDDPDLEDTLLLAGGQVIQHKVLYFPRLETMKVQNPVNRQLDGMRCPRPIVAILRARDKRGLHWRTEVVSRGKQRRTVCEQTRTGVRAKANTSSPAGLEEA